jgi:preprotein translocase subunit SecE
MKKQNQRQKRRKSTRKKDSASKKREVVNSSVKSTKKTKALQAPVRNIPKKPAEKKGTAIQSVPQYVGKARQFLREAKVELKKVKWPTRKELLASTGVVIILVLVIAFYLGLVDFGLIKIIKNIVG